jgi:hypothetical protein
MLTGNEKPCRRAEGVGFEQVAFHPQRDLDDVNRDVETKTLFIFMGTDVNVQRPL